MSGTEQVTMLLSGRDVCCRQAPKVLHQVSGIFKHDTISTCFSSVTLVSHVKLVHQKDRQVQTSAM